MILFGKKKFNGLEINAFTALPRRATTLWKMALKNWDLLISVTNGTYKKTFILILKVIKPLGNIKMGKWH